MQGKPGTEIRVRNADGSAGRVIRVLSQGRPGKPLPTTIDANLQAEAEKDVKKQGPDASVVAVQPSTGDVLAVAMTPAKGFDKAFQGTYAPGSTFKVITASTLLESGKFTPSTPLNCPQYFSYGGLTFHNVDKTKIDHATFAADFEASCNTAFMSTVQVLPDGAVEDEARDVFGLGLNWNTGVPSFDGSVPTTGGASKAMTYIGQGKVIVSPIDMASVVATAKAGVFRQPVIVPASVDGRQIAQAPRRLSASADAALRNLMKFTPAIRSPRSHSRGRTNRAPSPGMRNDLPDVRLPEPWAMSSSSAVRSQDPPSCRPRKPLTSSAPALPAHRPARQGRSGSRRQASDIRHARYLRYDQRVKDTAAPCTPGHRRSCGPVGPAQGRVAPDLSRDRVITLESNPHPGGGDHVPNRHRRPRRIAREPDCRRVGGT
ncbi:penicillin-binding transpeptidase domain-containing protein [Streptomyces sp. NBC_01450]|uniref:penicillin-binding transpeptidase domain-containing protein n=1 Tax=Streptomyces sp. NBC_01450 TaxID=2903871 RepID=UPI002E310F3D|nr:penicillin-binding transpeptidase domain-containing protein [Streptomyces sp. NBC_01450]